MAKIKVNTGKIKGKISKYIYGQFAEHLGRCIYEGIYVGEDSDIPNINGMRCDVVSALRELEIPVLRWPGGCFADDYHWRDGIGPKDKRPYMVNTNWGNVVENNHFGTHEFFELVEQLGTEPYICGNVGSGTVQEMRDWVEYMTFGGDSPLANERRKNGHDKPWKLKFFGVGNENWGCGGWMRPEYYADEYRRFSTFIRNYGDEPMYKIVGGPDRTDTKWMEVMMQEPVKNAGGVSLHNYTFTKDWGNKGSSTSDDVSDYYSLINNALEMDKTIKMHEEIMDKYDPNKEKGLIVDEWGNWFDVMPGTNPGFLYQQNTIRDAICGMITLHIFQNHCDRVYMANIAQMVNVLQAMILTEGEKMVKTPTYYLFKMMKNHMDSELLDIEFDNLSHTKDSVTIPKLSVNASEKSGEYLVTMCNTSLDDDEEIVLELDTDIQNASAVCMMANSISDYNEFDKDEAVCPKNISVITDKNTVKFTLPKMSVCAISIK